MKQRIGCMFSRIAGVVCLLTCFSSCLKTGSSVATSTNSASTYISVLHMAPYAPVVNVFFNGVQASQPVYQDTYFSSYSQVTPGSYDVKFEKDGTDSLVAEIPAQQYDSLNFYTLILYNVGDVTAKAVAIKDDFSNVTNVSSYFRFFNMNPDAGGVDVYFTNTQVESGRTPADNINVTTYNRFQEIDPGYYHITVKAAGTDSLITSSTTASLSAGNVYTILLMGKGAYNTISILPGAY